MLDRVDTRGHQVARIRDGRVHRHPGAGLVKRGHKLRDRADRVVGLGVSPGGLTGKVSDHLDPPRAPATLCPCTADQVGLVHRRTEQAGEAAAGGSREPARLQHRRPGHRADLQRYPARRSRVTHNSDPSLRQAIRSARAAALSKGSGPAGPAATAG